MQAYWRNRTLEQIDLGEIDGHPIEGTYWHSLSDVDAAQLRAATTLEASDGPIRLLVDYRVPRITIDGKSSSEIVRHLGAAARTVLQNKVAQREFDPLHSLHSAQTLDEAIVFSGAGAPLPPLSLPEMPQPE